MEFSKPPGSPFAAPRRVFTAPAVSANQQSASSSRSSDGSVDTLYDHPSVKIVSFTAGPRPIPISSRTAIAHQDVEPGTLAWSSQLERTIAAGPFRIYRAPGSVAFLSCGTALQPILPKSQVWCVDEGSSKFVLQIRRPQYWRIEVPVGNKEEERRAQLLREVFDKILQFEKTECPFKRAFTVELPEPPSTPVKKRPWTPPIRHSSISLPPTPVTPVELSRLKNSPAHERPLDSENSPLQRSDEQGTRNTTVCSEAHQGEYATVKEVAGEMASEEELTQDHGASPTSAPTKSATHPNVAELRGFYSSRSVTAPPQLLLGSDSSSRRISEICVPELIEEEPTSQSPAESQDSFHSPQSFLSTPLPPSPPQSNPPSPMGSPRLLQTQETEETTDHEDRSDLTVISNISQGPWSSSPTASVHSGTSECATAPSSVCDVDCPSPCEEPTTPSEASHSHRLTTSISNTSLSSSISDASSTSTTRRSHIRHRATTSSSISPSRRALSPLPSAVNLFSPRPALSTFAQKNALAAVRRLPMAVIQKTCEILMSPPSHLINLMLNVAARIAAGEWRGLVFGVDERGEQIPVQWDWSEEEDNSADDGKFVDEDWPPRWPGRRMAGTFPESDDEDDGTFLDDERAGHSDKDGESDWSRSLGVD